MSTKQDRVAPRTASDLERKYNFGQRFSEILGLIDDTRKDVDATESGLRSEILDQSTSIRRDTEKIVFEASKTVETVKENLEGRMDGIDGEGGSIETLTRKVDMQLTAEDVTIAVQKELINGVDSVKTITGYTFDEEGLTVSKTGSGLETKITEDGMKVISSTGEDLLTANHEGVDAVDLKASTYLIVGGRSRFENYEFNGINSTGCFWVGG